jgi:hypothetical protein
MGMATVTGTHPIRRTEATRLPRTTGALSGLLVILLGIWGGLVPFIGPYFHYAFGSFQTWHYTSERLWLNILPGAVAVIGGLMLLRSSSRTGGLIGGWLAVAAGAWFAIGPTVSLLWHHAGNPIGAPMGGYTRQAIEWLGYFQGLGVLIVGLAAFAMGRYYSRPRVVEEAVVAAEGEEAVLAGERPAHEADERALAADGEPVAAREDPVIAHEDRVTAHEYEGPVTAHEERVAARDEPAVSPAEEPTGVRSADPETLARTEPIAARDDEPAAAPFRGDEPIAARDEEPVTTSTGGVTYRRRPGLSRFRGRN